MSQEIYVVRLTIYRLAKETQTEPVYKSLRIVTGDEETARKIFEQEKSTLRQAHILNNKKVGYVDLFIPRRYQSGELEIDSVFAKKLDTYGIWHDDVQKDTLSMDYGTLLRTAIKWRALALQAHDAMKNGRFLQDSITAIGNSLSDETPWPPPYEIREEKAGDPIEG